MRIRAAGWLLQYSVIEYKTGDLSRYTQYLQQLFERHCKEMKSVEMRECGARLRSG